MKLRRSDEGTIKISEYIESTPEHFKLWIKEDEAQKYKMYIFSVTLNSVAELSLLWEKFTNDIALNFQAKLKENIELWNIYVVFFVNEKVNKDLKYTIQQDLYSSRKIVIDNFKFRFNDKYLQFYLEKKLFRLKINKKKRNQNQNIQEKRNLTEIINENNRMLFEAIRNNDDPAEVVEKYMELIK
jgi:hypothetical protein